MVKEEPVESKDSEIDIKIKIQLKLQALKDMILKNNNLKKI